MQVDVWQKSRRDERMPVSGNQIETWWYEREENRKGIYFWDHRFAWTFLAEAIQKAFAHKEVIVSFYPPIDIVHQTEILCIEQPSQLGPTTDCVLNTQSMKVSDPINTEYIRYPHSDDDGVWKRKTNALWKVSIRDRWNRNLQLKTSIIAYQ